MPFRTRTAVSGAILATATVLLCPAAAVARPAAAPAPPGWSAAPAPGDGAEPRAVDRPYFYLAGAPGTVMNDRLSLSNPTGRAVTVRLRSSVHRLVAHARLDGGEGAAAHPGERSVHGDRAARARPPATTPES